MTLKEIVEQLESCGYECVAGPLKNNVAFIALKEMAEGMTKGELREIEDKFWDAECSGAFDVANWALQNAEELIREIKRSKGWSK